MHLRPYQQTLAEQIRERFKAGDRRVLAVSPTGSGKTVLFSFITKNAIEKGNRVFILAHRSEILDQIEATLKQVDVPIGAIRAGEHNPSFSGVTVASVQTLVRRLDRVQAPNLIICDECFPAGTLIDGRPIETIIPGDFVTGWHNGTVTERVVSTMKRRPVSMTSIRLSDGRTINCTTNHPFLTQFGWVPAGRLTPQHMVLSIMPHELHHLRKPTSKETLRQSGMQITAFQDDYPEHIQAPRWGDYEVQKNQRNEQSSNSGFGIHQITSYGMETTNTRWKWKTPSTSTIASRIGSWLGNGTLYPNESAEIFWISNVLQGGYWEFRIEDSNRSGRGISSKRRDKSQRCKENEAPIWVGVESVEILKPTSDGTFGGVCPDGLVYNFETTRSHTYTANGIVVHNCHHGVSETYRKIFQAFSGSLVLGVTATPERLDGKGLGEFFQSLVIGPSTAWLVNEGFLAKPRYFSTPVQPDLEAVRRIAGDYAHGDLERAMDKPVITGDAIDHYRRICDGRTAIAFCASVNHAEHVAAQFQAVGIAAQSIDGRLAPDERRRRVLDLSQGRIRVLTSCELVSEGFDLPSVGAAILLRPTASLAMHLQQLGRALRPKPDGSGCVILDHAGNCMRHGLAEETRDWTLEGRTAKKRDKETVLATKTCPKCYAIFTGQTCPQCGTTQEKPREIETVPGELVELAFDQHYQTRHQISECKTLDDFRKLAKQRGYKPGWAWHRWKHRKSATRPAHAADTPTSSDPQS